MDLATVDHLLTSTRSVRKRLDLRRNVERDVIEECLEIAIQAPVGANIPKYHFVVETDPKKRKAIADLYKASQKDYNEYHATVTPTFPDREERFLESAVYLAEHLHEVPVHIIPCLEGRSEDPAPWIQASMYGQILPIAWSLMLALRARGLGSSWTTLHLVYEKEVAELLNIPSGVTQTALLPVAYFTGKDFRPAKRLPARDRTYWETWKSP
jgi:nitroreductase